MDQDKRCRSGAFDADQRAKLDSLFILISLLSAPRYCPEGEAFLLRNAPRQDMARRVLTNCWYVSCVSPSEWHSESERTSRSRKTKAFKNESEAKRFAKSMLSEGFEVTAGTLNPHLPKRVITASEIDQWVNGKERRDTAPKPTVGL
jgi:hypothetical protein